MYTNITEVTLTNPG